jgi:hypothetical protein
MSCLSDPRPAPRRFYLWRDRDFTGVSGTGTVAEGVLFSDGTVVLVWTVFSPSVVVRTPRVEGQDVMAEVVRIHGHDGWTRVEWIDD